MYITILNVTPSKKIEVAKSQSQQRFINFREKILRMFTLLLVLFYVMFVSKYNVVLHISQKWLLNYIITCVQLIHDFLLC